MQLNAVNNTLKRLVYANYDSAKAYQVAKLHYHNFLHSLNSSDREKVRHFYSEEEIEVLKIKWCRQAAVKR